MTLFERARTHLLESAEVQRQLADTNLESILAAASVIAGAFRAGHKLLLCGNGGSAADCQHMAAEFVGRLTNEFQRPGLPALALTTDTSFLTAHANDVGFESIFERQVQALGQSGDVLLGLTTSGASTNVNLAFKAAQTLGMNTIGLTGKNGLLKGKVEICIAVPSSNTQYIQEAHLAVEHIICELVEQQLLHNH